MENIVKVLKKMVIVQSTVTTSLFLVIHSYVAFAVDPSRKELAARAKELDKYLTRINGVLAETDPYYKYPLTEVQSFITIGTIKRDFRGSKYG